MIFSKTWQQVLDGTKTQTRRVINPNELASCGSVADIFAVWRTKDGRPAKRQSVRAPLIILEQLYNVKWTVAMGYWRDKTYAVQPGCGKRAVGRIKLTGIRQERLQDITIEDITAEGLPTSLCTYWDQEGYKDFDEDEYRFLFAELWDSIHRKGNRWADNPEVWVLEFKLINRHKAGES